MNKLGLRSSWDAALYAERLGQPTERPADRIRASYFDAREYSAPPRGSVIRTIARQATLSGIDPYRLDGIRARRKATFLEGIDESMTRTLKRVDWVVEMYAGHNPAGWLSAVRFIRDSKARVYELGDDNVGVGVCPSARTAQIATNGTKYLLSQSRFNDNDTPHTDTSVMIEGVMLPLAGMPMTAVSGHAEVVIDALSIARNNTLDLIPRQIL